jgi:hypothetical protein
MKKEEHVADEIRRTYFGIGAEKSVPPSERRREAVIKRLVMIVMVISESISSTGPSNLRASPERQDMSKTPWEIVSGVCVNSLPQSKGDPNIYRKDVKVLSEQAVEERSRDCSLRENHDLKRVRVFGSLVSKFVPVVKI